jgi:Tfp pilus assembly PilM family ATPase
VDISIYFSATALRIIVGSSSRDGFQVEEFHSECLPEGMMINGIITAPEALAHFLADCNQQWGPFKHNATAIIENNTIRSKRIELPALREAQLMPFVRTELTSLLEENADDVIDYAVTGSDSVTGATKALGVVAGRVQLQNYASVMREAGFNLKRIDVGANALAKLPRILTLLQTGIRMLGIIDSNLLALVYYQQGEYMLARRYRLLAPEATDERRTEIAGHLSAMLQFQKSQNRDAEMDVIYLTGIPPERVQMLSASAAYLGVLIEALEKPEALSLRGKAAFEATNFDLSAYLYNIGALLPPRSKGR